MNNTEKKGLLYAILISSIYILIATVFTIVFELIKIPIEMMCGKK